MFLGLCADMAKGILAESHLMILNGIVALEILVVIKSKTDVVNDDSLCFVNLMEWR